MIWAIISVLSNSIGGILRKKSLNLTKISGFLFQLYSHIFGGLLFFIIFLLSGKLNFENFTFVLLAVLFVVRGITMIAVTIEQKIYKVEKMSTLMPFENLQKVFVVIISYFLFSDTSITTLLITVLAIITIILFKIDFKNFKFPVFIKPIILTNIIYSIESIITGYLLTKVNFQTFMTIDFLIISFIFAGILINKRKELKGFFKQTNEFYAYRLGSSITGKITLAISLYLMSEFGIITTMLLGFLGIGFKLIFAYFILGEKPDRKDIFLSIILAFLIGIGYYYK